MEDTWTSVEDFLGMWVGEGAPDDFELITRWIRRAERLIRREIPDLTKRLQHSSGEPDLLESVRDVVVAMVTRVFRNPEGIRTIQDSTGGVFSGSTTYAGANPGGLYLEEWERAQLRNPATAGRGKAFSISMSEHATVPSHAPWCDLAWGRACSCGAILTGAQPLFEGGDGI